MLDIYPLVSLWYSSAQQFNKNLQTSVAFEKTLRKKSTPNVAPMTQIKMGYILFDDSDELQMAQEIISHTFLLATHSKKHNLLIVFNFPTS